ncbi:ectoine/hydroxyectoine ABC transporter substrate-binding protein EhuB [Streptomyces californicus]
MAYANEAPYGYLEGKELKGEAPTLHREIFKALGVDEVSPDALRVGRADPRGPGGQVRRGQRGHGHHPRALRQRDLLRAGVHLADRPDGRGGDPKKVTDLASAKKAGITIGVMSGAVEDHRADGRP